MKPDLHTLAGAYALDALTETERRHFERHLTGCPSCTQEVQELHETTARLAVAAAQPPPAALRERVLADAARTRQLPPRLSTRLPRRSRGVSWILAAACLLIALITGITAIGPGHHAQRAESLNHQISAVMAAPDARTVTGHLHPSGTATITTSRSLDKAVITASGLPALPAAKTYQLWFMGAGPPRSAGLLRPSTHTTARSLLAGPIASARQIGMTIEPAGGSAAPTAAPILTAPLS